jgi:hypothetical protein
MTMRGRLAVLGTLAGLCVALTAGLMATGAQATPDQKCATDGPPCVMLVQVAGLEPKDVTAETTPFLWALAHPATPGPFSQLLTGRAGFTWQGGRTGMQAGSAASTATILTGSYPEQSGVPSDEYRNATADSNSPARTRLGAPAEQANEGGAERLDFNGFQQDTLFQLLQDDSDEVDSAAFVGDPAVAPMIIDGDEADNSNVKVRWSPNPNAGSDGTPTPPSPDNAPPEYCPVPRDPTSPQFSDASVVGCVAPDAQTLYNASTKLESEGGDVVFTYIQLGELGAVKRMSSDVDSQPNDSDPEKPSPVAKALAQTDEALALFFAKYSNPPATTATRWPHTVVMVVGDHGYEQTLPSKRVPDPATSGQDLANYVASGAGDSQLANKFELIPQGTVATVYPLQKFADPNGTAAADTVLTPSAAHRDAVAKIKAAIETQVNNACKAAQDGTDCVEEVLYMRPELTPADTTDAVQTKHPDWNLDVHKFEEGEDKGPNGSSGDLIVVLKPGWAAGKAVPSQDEALNGGESVTNPYLASSGGPRNRAVAAIINGPPSGIGEAIGVRSLAVVKDNPARYPVFTADSSDPSEVVNAINPKCRDRDSQLTAKYPAGDVAQANANPSDDANGVGHLCQFEMVDVAPTIAALFKMTMPPEQIAGRPLNEAFQKDLAIPCEDCEPKIPELYPGPVGPWTPPPTGENPQVAAKRVTFDWINLNEPTATYECALDVGMPGGHDFQACGETKSEKGNPSYTTPPLKIGEHTFEVRGRSVAGVGEPIHTTFETVPFFDFQGILQKLRAHVTDSKGHPVRSSPDMLDAKERRIRPARHGAKLNDIDVRADFGRPFSTVRLTLYNRPRLPGGGCNRKGRCVLRALAKFPAFTIVRGPVELLFGVPQKAFGGKRKPTHVGLSVRELRLVGGKLKNCQAHPTRKSCKYKETGPRKGGIVPIKDASWLFKRR